MKKRFGNNFARHKDLEWPQLQAKHETNFEKLWVLSEMEINGKEPYVVAYDKETAENIF